MSGATKPGTNEATSTGMPDTIDSDLLTAPYERLLAAQCTPQAVRAIEGGASPDALWAQLDGSGFLDALRPEAAGGAGLTLAQALPLFEAEGHHALPLPAAHTMFVRAALANEDAEVPPGPIAIASRVRLDDDGSVRCPGTPYGRLAAWVVVPHPGGWWLLPAATAQRTPDGIHGSLLADLHWPAPSADARRFTSTVPWHEAGALLSAAQLAGALQRVLDMTVDYANQREQFGRSIGKFQAIQHQLAQLAEHVAASRMAAALGCSGATLWPLPLRAALAKARASEAAALAAHIAHAVHGAIGVTAEFDLQLFTRRLHEWRAAFGAETHWHRVLGRALLDETSLSTLDFMRTALWPACTDTL